MVLYMHVDVYICKAPSFVHTCTYLYIPVHTCTHVYKLVRTKYGCMDMAMEVEKRMTATDEHRQARPPPSVRPNEGTWPQQRRDGGKVAKKAGEKVGKKFDEKCDEKFDKLSGSWPNSW